MNETTYTFQPWHLVAFAASAFALGGVTAGAALVFGLLRSGSKLNDDVRSRRGGFTLVELLAVTAVVAVLLALTAAGIMHVHAEKVKAADGAETQELRHALGKFYAKYQCWPPDRVKLCPLLSDYDPVADRASLDSLQRVWPQLFKSGKPIAWAGLGVQLPPGGAALDDAQTLVFFLGGLGGTRGFTESATAPLGDPKLAYSRVAFYEFRPSRLTVETFPKLLNNSAVTVFGHRGGEVYLK